MDDLPKTYKRFRERGLAENDALQSIALWTKSINDWAVEKGWWPFTREDREFSETHHDIAERTLDPFYYLVMEKLGLIGTEVSEAIEEWRRGKPLLYEIETTDDRDLMELTLKPEGVMVELADVVIRVFDLAHALDPSIDFGVVLAWKMAYNQKRPRRHGGLKG